jgi:GT2 family glycosyltransferase
VADVAVVVGNYQGAAVLADCLQSLPATVAEVIVADGASTDGSDELAAGLGARVLRLPNIGLGHLYNRGVEAARAPYVLLLNNDVALEPSCLDELAAALDDDDRRFCADPAQLDWSGDRAIHARTLLSRGRLTREYLPGLHLDHLVEAPATAETVAGHGAAMLVRQEGFRELGGFDETFFMEWEDLDLCWRAWLRGWPSVHVPAARVRHRVGAVTTKAVLPRRAASSHHNIIRFALKCLPPGAAARVVLGELLRLPNHPRAIASAFRATAAELPEILALRRRIGPSHALLEAFLASGDAPTFGYAHGR